MNSLEIVTDIVKKAITIKDNCVRAKFYQKGSRLGCIANSTLFT